MCPSAEAACSFHSAWHSAPHARTHTHTYTKTCSACACRRGTFGGGGSPEPPSQSRLLPLPRRGNPPRHRLPTVFRFVSDAFVVVLAVAERASPRPRTPFRMGVTFRYNAGGCGCWARGAGGRAGWRWGCIGGVGWGVQCARPRA